MSITITDLSKSYGKKEVLKGATYTFHDGMKYVIHSKNGSGKTTLIRAILSQIHYNGSIECTNIISYCPEGGLLPPSMPAEQFIRDISNLRIRVRDFDMKLDMYAELLGARKLLKAKCGSLSRGEKQKISLIQCLITESDSLFFDEPLSGLDDESRGNLVDLLSKEKRMVIVITHEIIRFKNDIFKVLEIANGKISEVSKAD